MSVLNELTEISESVLPPLPPETTEIEQSEETLVSTESFYKFDKNTVTKFNNLYEQVLLKKVIKNSVKLDRSIACEVFTMLGNEFNTEPAKLTTAPSVNNKQVADKAISSISDTPEVEMLSTLSSFKDQITLNLEKINKLYASLQVLREILTSYDTKFREIKPIVIYYSKAFNLYGDSIGDLLSIDDTVIEYPKYNNALYNKLNAVASDESLRNYIAPYLSNDNTSGDIIKVGSLETLVNKILFVVNLLDRQIKDLLAYKTELVNTSNLDNTVYSDQLKNTVNELPIQIDAFNHINTFNNLITTEDSFITKLEDLLGFID